MLLWFGSTTWRHMNCSRDDLPRKHYFFFEEDKVGKFWNTKVFIETKCRWRVGQDVRVCVHACVWDSIWIDIWIVICLYINIHAMWLPENNLILGVSNSILIHHLLNLTESHLYNNNVWHWIYRHWLFLTNVQIKSFKKNTIIEILVLHPFFSSSYYFYFSYYYFTLNFRGT